MDAPDAAPGAMLGSSKSIARSSKSWFIAMSMNCSSMSGRPLMAIMVVMKICCCSARVMGVAPGRLLILAMGKSKNIPIGFSAANTGAGLGVAAVPKRIKCCCAIVVI